MKTSKLTDRGHGDIKRQCILPGPNCLPRLREIFFWSGHPKIIYIHHQEASQTFSKTRNRVRSFQSLSSRSWRATYPPKRFQHRDVHKVNISMVLQDPGCRGNVPANTRRGEIPQFSPPKQRLCVGFGCIGNFFLMSRYQPVPIHILRCADCGRA